ncbi:MAG TPA: hypothetical protein PKH72_13125 [Rhodoferax sp.]|nr:hypothetical protein [Rhodoferax sp.]HNV60588.1 hypothetical protein [Rhodoferax sp.]HPW28410.1 hypothetical protein [Rhodoferax sp.]
MATSDSDRFSDGASPSSAPGAVWLLAALALTVLGALPLVLDAPWAPWFSAVGVALVSFAVVGWLLSQVQAAHARAAQAQADARDAARQSAQELASLLLDILPAWQHHVGLVKSQTETAVTQLTGSFAQVLEQFDLAGIGGASSIGASSANNTISLLDLCERELQPVVLSLTNVIDSKDALLVNIRNLAQETLELQAMAAEVRSIAAQTNLLALNAAIEAAGG